MNIIEWNIGYGANPTKVYEALQEYMNETFVITLLEVTPAAYDSFMALFEGKAKLEYSLTYRAPGMYDSKARKLGVLLITSNDVEILEAGVFSRTLLPERTLYAKLCINEKEIKIGALHSITGSNHFMAKSHNFRSIAEEVDRYEPDIFVMDANEPKIDHFDIDKMLFFEKNGEGAKIFFNTLVAKGLKDSFAKNYDTNQFVEGAPLAVSHMINRKKPARYDFIFANEKLNVIEVKYEYEKAVDATADHAIVVAKVV